ncbi:MAG: hypothetical protein RLZZ127_2716 [Planctomycetota bacterium]|jgi:hypothetical protein
MAPSEPDWSETTREGHERAVRSRAAALAPWDRLRLLDDIEAFVALIRQGRADPRP